MLAVVFLPSMFLYFVYVVYATAKWGKTIGKAVMGLEVVNETNKRPTVKQAFFRELITKQLSFVPFGAGAFAILFDPNHQAWHDTLSGTFVTKQDNRTALGILLTIGYVVALFGVTTFIVFTALNNAPLRADFLSMMPR